MGSGLIFAGLGQGISNAGAAYGNAMSKAAEIQWKQEEEDRSYQRKLDMEEKRAETLKQRVISEIQAANAKADQIAADRASKQLDTDAGKIAAVTPSMDQAQVKQLMQDNPAYVEAHRKAGVIGAAMTPNQQLKTAAQDKIDAALSIGAHSSVVEAFQKSKESLLKEIRDENRDKYEEARIDQGERRLDILDKRVTSQNSTDNIKANKPSASKPDPANKPPTSIDLERNTKAAKEALAMELGVPVKDVSEKVAQLRKKGALSEGVQTRLDAYTTALSKWQNYKSNLPSSTDNSSDNSSSRPPIGSFRR